MAFIQARHSCESRNPVPSLYPEALGSLDSCFRRNDEKWGFLLGLSAIPDRAALQEQFDG
jgi:hypothetical protein